MALPPPTFLDPAKAGEILARAIRNPEKPQTVADAAAASGLALRDTERGLHWLMAEYRGQLRVTNDGDLLFFFPNGFTRPWERRSRIKNGLRAVGRFFAGLGRFVVRAWLAVVLLGYVALFVGITVAMLFGGRSSDSNSSRGGAGLGEAGFVLLRVIGDALFWTFHPWSPMSWEHREFASGHERRRSSSRQREEPKMPFYERVNRFFFGPTEPVADPLRVERALVALIRARDGRIGLADVMAVTGLPREEADPLMARLMLDYEGDVTVSEEGGVSYRFETLRKTTSTDRTPLPPPAWESLPTLPPLMGNPPGSNFLIAALNTFNIVMSLVAIDSNLTVQKLTLLTGRIPLQDLPYDGTPWVLGVVPLVFSAMLFALPIGRAVLRPRKERKLAATRGRLAVLRETLAKLYGGTPVTDEALTAAYAQASGRTPTSREMTRVVVDLGGDAQIDDAGRVRYRFPELETEGQAVERERREAPASEAQVAPVVFGTDT